MHQTSRAEVPGSNQEAQQDLCVIMWKITRWKGHPTPEGEQRFEFACFFL